jgi:hypothetical protein
MNISESIDFNHNDLSHLCYFLAICYFFPWYVRPIRGVYSKMDV